MTDRQAFVEAVSAQPGEDTPRLVFADFLRDHGEDELADFITPGFLRVLLAFSVWDIEVSVRPVFPDEGGAGYQRVLPGLAEGHLTLEVAGLYAAGDVYGASFGLLDARDRDGNPYRVGRAFVVGAELTLARDSTIFKARTVGAFDRV